MKKQKIFMSVDRANDFLYNNPGSKVVNIHTSDGLPQMVQGGIWGKPYEVIVVEYEQDAKS